MLKMGTVLNTSRC